MLNGESKESQEFSLLMFRHYQKLGAAVIKQYQSDKSKEEKKLMREKEKLVKRLKDGKSSGLVHRFQNPMNAWICWEHAFQNFESFCYWEKTDVYKFYKELCEMTSETDENYIYKGKLYV